MTNRCRLDLSVCRRLSVEGISVDGEIRREPVHSVCIINCGRVMIVTCRLNARRSNSLSPEHRRALDLVIAFAAWKSSFAGGVAPIPTTILRYGSIIERRIIADFPRKRAEARHRITLRRSWKAMIQLRATLVYKLYRRSSRSMIREPCTAQLSKYRIPFSAETPFSKRNSFLLPCTLLLSSPPRACDSAHLDERRHFFSLFF